MAEGKKQPPARGKAPAGGCGEKQLFLFLFRGSSFLGSLSFGHALLEFIHATGGIDEFLCAGIKWMAGVANADNDGRLDGTRLDHVATSATDFRFRVFRMYINSHKRDENLAAFAFLTSANLKFQCGILHFELPKCARSFSACSDRASICIKAK
jgi:hypothetical protein